MNWREQPELFIRSFGINTEKGAFGATEWQYDFWSGGILCGESIESQFRWCLDTKNCTLIARKIEDMTDEGIEKLFPDFAGLSRELAIRNVMFMSDELEGALQVLSVGVLPRLFTWDETVIETKGGE